MLKTIVEKRRIDWILKKYLPHANWTWAPVPQNDVNAVNALTIVQNIAENIGHVWDWQWFEQRIWDPDKFRCCTCKCWPVSHWNVWHVANTGQHNSYIIYASHCAFCREVVPTKPFTSTALYCILQNDAWIWTNPPCYKMGWGFLWWIKSQCRSLMVTTKWLCVPIL